MIVDVPEVDHILPFFQIQQIKPLPAGNIGLVRRYQLPGLIFILRYLILIIGLNKKYGGSAGLDRHRLPKTS